MIRTVITRRTKPRVISFAPQFLVEDLARSVACYERPGFVFGEPWGTQGFYIEDPDGCIVCFGWRHSAD
jgi:hypothetical protein